MSIMTVDQTSVQLRRALGGDEAGVQWILRRFTPGLLVSARHRMAAALRAHYDPEDLVQDVWSVALTNLGKLEPRDERYTPVFVRYLASILWRRHSTLLRRHQDQLHLVEVESGSVLQDLDEMEAYERLRP